MKDRAARRTGDIIAIDGAYQFNALRTGPAARRFWHHSKLRCVDALLPPAPGDHVLDVGCGSGVVTSHLARRGARALGIDANPAAIEFARRQFGGENARFQLGLVDDGFSTGEPVDKAYCLEVVEHIYRAQALSMLVRIREALRPGGTFVCKIFQGDDFRGFTEEVKAAFQECKIFKPQSSRKASKEIYLVGKARK